MPEPLRDGALSSTKGHVAMVSLLRTDLVLLAGIGLGVFMPWVVQLPWRKRLMVFAACGTAILAGSFV